MQPNNNIGTVVLLAIALLLFNGKAIVEYILWLRFKIETYFKQLDNERRNNPHRRP